MAKLGFDHVRLSIDAVPLEQYPRGKDGLNAEFLARLDRAVDAMLADGLAVQIDLHPEDSYKQQLRTSDDAVDRLTMLWRRLAAHYARRDPERVFFEILNEPEVNDAYRWAGIQARLAAAIREVAPSNTIIATGAQLLRHPGPAHPASAQRRQRDLYLPLLRSDTVYPPGRGLGRSVVELYAWDSVSGDGRLDAGAVEAGSGCGQPLPVGKLLAGPLGCAPHPAHHRRGRGLGTGESTCR